MRVEKNRENRFWPGYTCPLEIINERSNKYMKIARTSSQFHFCWYSFPIQYNSRIKFNTLWCCRCYERKNFGGFRTFYRKRPVFQFRRESWSNWIHQVHRRQYWLLVERRKSACNLSTEHSKNMIFSEWVLRRNICAMTYLSSCRNWWITPKSNAP